MIYGEHVSLLSRRRSKERRSTLLPYKETLNSRDFFYCLVLCIMRLVIVDTVIFLFSRSYFKLRQGLRQIEVTVR